MSDPTAHTSVLLLPHSPISGPVTLLVDCAQAVPLKCKMSPQAPTAHTSLAPLPQTPWMRFRSPVCWTVHAVPFQ